MRKTIWKITVFITILLMSSLAFSEGLNGWISITDNANETYQNGDRTHSTDSFRRNVGLGFKKSITSLVSYDFNLNSSLMDTTSTNSAGVISKSYSRNIEPELNLYLRNNIYDVTAGYRVLDQWSTAHYTNASRLTTELYYASFEVMPNQLPSFSFDIDRQEKYDHLATMATNSINDSYRVASSYRLPSKAIGLGYNISLTRDEQRNPLNRINKTTSVNFTNNYNIGYRDSLWGGKVNYSAGYQGNYARKRGKRYVTLPGSIVEERTANNGFNVQNTDQQVKMNSNSALTDGNLTTSANIDLSADTYNHIGIQVLFGESVDRLYIYVDGDLDPEINLELATKWEIYKSNFNQDNGWTQVAITSVSTETYDALNSKWRYVIEFLTEQEAFYFKAINLATSSGTVPTISVTEIEAHGTVVVGDTNISKTVSKVFSQGLGFNAGFRPNSKLDFNANYSLSRSDQRPETITDSVSGFLGNMFGKSFDNQRTTSSVSKSYSASARWIATPQLFSTFNISRNESFDNLGTTDSSGQTYQAAVNYSPIPTLNGNLSAIRNELFSFGTKTQVKDSFYLSLGTKLYKDLNMITDGVLTKTLNVQNNSESETRTITGTIDAAVTKKLNGSANYGFSTTTSGDTTSKTTNASTSVTYRAGKFISFSGDYNYIESGGNETVTEGVAVDWLPLPRIKLNAGYRHSVADVESTTSDSIDGYAVWYITRSIDLRVSYAYTQVVAVNNNETYKLTSNLNCRF